MFSTWCIGSRCVCIYEMLGQLCGLVAFHLVSYFRLKYFSKKLICLFFFEQEEDSKESGEEET